MYRPLRSTDPVRLGGYDLAGRLGEGGQGVVYLGRAADGPPVAIKVLHAALGDDERARRLVFRELRAARRVDSSCTAQIVDVVIGGDVSFIVTEYVEGLSLRDAVKQQGPMSGGRLERIAVAMATALTAIHRAGVVHRDFKPGNVLLGPDGPRVIDFGIARLLDTAASSSSQLMGTPPFMAPEQFRGERAGPAADMFAWGCSVTYAANGCPPFDGDCIPAIMNRILNGDPNLGDLEGSLREAVLACLHKNPRRRPAAHQLLAWLLGDETAWSSSMASVCDHKTQTAAILDVTTPNVARAYDAFLGGKDNFAVDREVVRRTNEVLPDAPASGRANRAFLRRVVRYLVGEAGIKQFIDLGSGLPSAGNVHEVAQAIDPTVRVVYVDNDPMVLVHARALLATNDTTTVITQDIRRPQEILENAEVGAYIDFSRPVGLLMFAILHHINDWEHPAGIARTLHDALPSGSYVAISHFCSVSEEYPDEAERTTATEKIFNETLGTGRWRHRKEILGYLGDSELIDPGLVPIQQWRPDPNDLGEPLSHHWFVGGVAHKR